MGEFYKALHITPGVTAIIGSGGKTSLMYRLAEELAPLGRVIVTTTTHIWKPEHLPFAETANGEVLLCVGMPTASGKLTAPAQSMEELALLADFVLVEADGSKGKPLKAHESHEPVIPENAAQVLCVVGASGLYCPISKAVHRPERFRELSGSEIATPEAVAAVLEKEGLSTRILINQIDTQEAEARALAELIKGPVALASVKKGEIQCW